MASLAVIEGAVLVLRVRECSRDLANVTNGLQACLQLTLVRPYPPISKQSSSHR